MNPEKQKITTKQTKDGVVVRNLGTGQIVQFKDVHTANMSLIKNKAFWENLPPEAIKVANLDPETSTEADFEKAITEYTRNLPVTQQDGVWKAISTSILLKINEQKILRSKLVNDQMVSLLRRTSFGLIPAGNGVEMVMDNQIAGKVFDETKYVPAGRTVPETFGEQVLTSWKRQWNISPIAGELIPYVTSTANIDSWIQSWILKLSDYPTRYLEARMINAIKGATPAKTIDNTSKANSFIQAMQSLNDELERFGTTVTDEYNYSQTSDGKKWIQMPKQVGMFVHPKFIRRFKNTESMIYHYDKFFENGVSIETFTIPYTVYNADTGSQDEVNWPEDRILVVDIEHFYKSLETLSAREVQFFANNLVQEHIQHYWGGDKILVTGAMFLFIDPGLKKEALTTLPS